MALKARLSVTQTQSLALTPALRVSIHLLQLSIPDLVAFIDEKVEENPVLERLDGPPTARRPHDSLDFLETRLPSQTSLSVRLLDQIGLTFSDALERRIALTLLEELDESGYLLCDLSEVAARLGCAEDGVLSVLHRLQGFEPSGLFARSLSECLGLQLAAQGRLDPLFQALLEELDLLSEAGPKALQQALGLSAETLQGRLATLRTLDPKPGLSGQEEPVVPRVPDLLVTRQGQGRLTVAVNPETIPRIALDRDTHSRLAPRLRRPEERSYLSEKTQEVAWLRRALQRRYRTLQAVGEALLVHQGAYFEAGPAALKPLTRRSLAETLELSEATISRVVANKFLASPRGIEPLKRFFSAALGSEGAVSAAAAQARLQELVAGEQTPMSDALLAARLSAGGHPVARRTVAKYRDLLRIPPAADRRRLALLRQGVG
ncbi:MAG: hypothetical protein Kilf2KO_36920 [Rhodospirillales bacterium]